MLVKMARRTGWSSKLHRVNRMLDTHVTVSTEHTIATLDHYSQLLYFMISANGTK